jgi:hypothetical protein
MFSVITSIYNKKTKGPALMELLITTGKLIFIYKTRIIAAVKNIDASILMRVWEGLEYRFDVCRVTRVAQNRTSLVAKKQLFHFSFGCEQFH